MVKMVMTRCRWAGVLAAAGFLLLAAPQASAQCYPGLPCPGGQTEGGADGKSLPDNSSGNAQNTPTGTGGKFYYVGEVAPPDPWLALRSEPSSTGGERIAKMPAGTLLRLIERRGGWWQVELTTGERGWAHSKWIKCCKSGNE